MSGIFPAQIKQCAAFSWLPCIEGTMVQDEQVAAMTDEEILALPPDENEPVPHPVDG
jgi:hypothetical protein